MNMKEITIEDKIEDQIRLSISHIESNRGKSTRLVGMGIYPLVDFMEKELGFENKTGTLEVHGHDFDFTYEFSKNNQNYFLFGSLVDGIFIFEKSHK